MKQLVDVEQPRKAEIFACCDDKASATGIFVWKVRPETISISYGRILGQSASGNDIKNNNTLEN